MLNVIVINSIIIFKHTKGDIQSVRKEFPKDLGRQLCHNYLVVCHGEETSTAVEKKKYNTCLDWRMTIGCFLKQIRRGDVESAAGEKIERAKQLVTNKYAENTKCLLVYSAKKMCLQMMMMNKGSKNLTVSPVSFSIFYQMFVKVLIS